MQAEIGSPSRSSQSEGWCPRVLARGQYRKSPRSCPNGLLPRLGLRELKKLDTPAGVAPAESLYKRNPQAAAWRKNGSQSPVPPWARLAYDACLSAGSTAVAGENGAPTRNCTELTPIPREDIAGYALRALKLVGARRLARPRLPDSESGGSSIPRKPRAEIWRP